MKIERKSRSLAATILFVQEGPHQGLDNKPIVLGKPPPAEDIPSQRTVVCRERLGGLLRHYERRAA